MLYDIQVAAKNYSLFFAKFFMTYHSVSLYIPDMIH